MTDLIILATLLSGPRHGYHIKRQAGIILGQELLHNNLVYPLLRRFVANKWITRKTAPGERGQTRNLYAMTALGKTELIARLSDFSQKAARASDAFRLRVGLFQLLEQETRNRILDLREQVLHSRLEKLKGIIANFAMDRFAAEVTSRSSAEAKGELEWIRHLRRIAKKERVGR